MRWLTVEVFNPLDIIFVFWAWKSLLDGHYVEAAIAFTLAAAFAFCCGILKGKGA